MISKREKFVGFDIVKLFLGTSWGHGNRKNQFGIEICQRPIFRLPGSLSFS